jgi:nicotinamide mononucleotide adenylyltransferase
VVQFIESQSDTEEIIIMKGSAQWNDENPDPYSLLSRNPFRAEECWTMIRRSLTFRIKKPWRVVELPDTMTRMTDPLWTEWVDSIATAVGTKNFVVYTNDPREVRAFARIGVQCRPFRVENRPHATTVREKIANAPEEEWRMYVDPEVAEYINMINGPSRIARLLEKERREK